MSNLKRIFYIFSFFVYINVYGESSVAMKNEVCDNLKESLQGYIDSKDASIGVAVILNDTDTISINGDKDFPMMSVFKFPLALTLTHYVDSRRLSLNDTIAVTPEDLKENTYSPMLLKYGRRPLKISLLELLEWSLQESDNNAADIILNYVGGVKGINDIMSEILIPSQIKIGASEDDMHRNPTLVYLNSSTPLAMAELFNNFRNRQHESESLIEIATMMETCKTGTNRLKASLNESDVIIGHKTGTGDVLPTGKISAINDCGYVILPNGQYYSIAVFIANSSYNMQNTEKIIADISRVVYNAVVNK